MEKRDILRIAKGNDFTLLITLSQKMVDGGELVTGDISDTTTAVIIVKENGSRIHIPKKSSGMEAHALQWDIETTDEGKAVAITIPCESQQLGLYGLEIKGDKNGCHWRYKAKPGEAFEIVDATSEQHIPDDQVRVFALNAFVGIGAGVGGGGGGGSTEQVQSDWDENDETSPAFIKNKPNIPSLDGYATEGYVTSYVSMSLTGYATTGLVNALINNRIVDSDSLSDPHTQTFSAYAIAATFANKNDLNGLASQTWVNQQNFLKEHQSLAGYATQQWVNDQNFLKTHQDISGKENRMQIVVPNSLSFSADTGKYYRITQSGTITVTLPSVVSNYLEGFLLFFTAASDDCLHFATQDTVIFADGYEIKAGDICEVNAVYNGDGWQVTLVKFN